MSYAPGTQWIHDPQAIRSHSIIAGEVAHWGGSILLGDAILGGNAAARVHAILCGDAPSWSESAPGGGTAAWSDPLMILKQPAMDSTIPWGEGVIRGEAIVSGNRLVWDGIECSAGILQATSGAWTSAFIDPTPIAISNESILVHGELGAPIGMKLAASGSLYFPAK